MKPLQLCIANTLAIRWARFCGDPCGRHRSGCSGVVAHPVRLNGRRYGVLNVRTSSDEHIHPPHISRWIVRHAAFGK
jgi:hypothetical protein